MSGDPLVAGVELGGTKAIALLARGRTILAQIRVATTSPPETLGALSAQLRLWQAQERFAALGIASFGPIRVDPVAPDFGSMLATPKPGWSGVDVARILTSAIDLPWRVDTDVNAAALAEWRWGAAQGLGNVCYITIGTGVGGGILVDGKPVHGMLHPEIGHLRLRRAAADAFPGACPFHGDCVEGLISGPALRERFGRKVAEVPEDDPRWAFVVHDLAELIGAIVLMASPHKVLIGGGVGMGRPELLDRVREAFVERIGGYLPHVTRAAAQALIEHPALGDDAGPLGAIALAQAALEVGQ